MACEPLEDHELNCLVGWPNNTVGYYNELRLIAELNRLCKEFGYGRVPQVAEQIQEIWNDKEKIRVFEAQREHRLLLLSRIGCNPPQNDVLREDKDQRFFLLINQDELDQLDEEVR